MMENLFIFFASLFLIIKGVLNKEYFYDKENRLIEENSGSEKTKYTYLDPTHFKEEKEYSYFGC